MENAKENVLGLAAWTLSRASPVYKLLNLLTIVSNPEHKDDIRSFPARAVTIVLWAPETAENIERKLARLV